MKIAQVMLAKGFGGAERSFVDITQELVARGLQVLAICETRGKAREMLDGVPIFPITVRGHWDLLAQRRLQTILRREAPDIVHAHLARAAKFAGKATLSLQIPSLVKTHNYVDLKYYQHVDCLVPTTHDQARYLLDEGIDPARVSRIPNFTAMPLADDARRLDGSEPIRLVAIGRFVHKKGFDLLLDAFSDLSKASNLHLTIIGDGELRTELRDMAAALDIGSKVSFPGWSDDIRQELDNADLFVLPSRDEPFGIVCLEAMARGVPIVATRTQGPIEIFDDSSAILVEKNSSDALAAGITAALRDKNATHLRAVKALKDCRTHFTKEVVVDRYVELYERLTASTR